MAKATTNMVPSAIRCSWLSTSNVQRGGTKKKLKAVTAPNAHTTDASVLSVVAANTTANT